MPSRSGELPRAWIEPYEGPTVDESTAPRSADELERLALEAYTACPPRFPGDWGGVSTYLRSLELGRDHRRALVWAQRKFKARGPAHSDEGHAWAVVDYSGTTTGQPIHVGHACRYCGAPAQAMDHVWPKYRGGDDHPNNLVPACHACNNWKGFHSWLTERCPSCEAFREPSDVVTATGDAFYACRCGSSWRTRWDLQNVPAMGRRTPSQW